MFYQTSGGSNLRKTFQALFLIAGILTILEFIFIKGMFTWLIMTSIVCLVGVINIFLAIKDRNYMEAFLYLVASIALIMGYINVA